jgi:hypothetical protein
MNPGEPYKMGKLNILVYLNAYKDANASNNPSLNNFKWTREVQGVEADKAQSVEFTLSPGESRVLFSGARAILSDNTTEFAFSLKSGTTNTYKISYVSGQIPAFRTGRAIGSDATTVVTVTTSGALATFQSTGGTIYSMSSVVVGDEVSIGTAFDAANRGRFKVLAKTADSFTVENTSAVAESAVVLGPTFADEVRIYSASGVQVGDKIKLGSGFNLLNQATYEVTGVQDNLVEFFSASTLPPEPSVTGPDVTIYSSAKKVMYLETNKKVGIEINGQQESGLEPFIEGNNSLPGVLLKRSTMWSVEVTNESTDMATLYFASVE